MKAKNFQGFSFHSLLIHSIWITVVGIILFRLATANTQHFIYVQIFAISGVTLATAPWVLQLIISMAIILCHNFKVCDLTWLVMSPAAEASCCGNSNEDNSDGEGWIGSGNECGLVMYNKRNEVTRRGLGTSKLLQIAGSDRKLQRNWTV